MRLLEEEGVDDFDVYWKDNFNLCALLLCIINIFPTYENLSGHSVRRHLVCPICEEDTSYQELKHPKKYMSH